MQIDKSQKFRILLSRTDSIGDVVLTLPMAGWIKKHFPLAIIVFMGRTYTRDVILLSEHVSEFVNADELEALPNETAIEKLKALQLNAFVHVFPNKKIAALAKMAAVPLRVGTTNRIFHWWTCNKKIALSRKKSDLHEAQLNLQLLSFLDIPTAVALRDLPQYYGISAPKGMELPGVTAVDNKLKVILHPRSKGSAREWGLVHFLELIRILPADKFQIYISGTAQDAVSMERFLNDAKQNPHVTDLTGKMNLQQFIYFISNCDALVAASTGPLHISAALGKKAIGLFSPRRPIHPGRWAPMGTQAIALVHDQNCSLCAEGKDCDCITKITPQRVADLLAS